MSDGQLSPEERLRHEIAGLPVDEILALCYAFGFVSGVVVIPWLVDRGLFPVRRHSGER